MQKRWMWAVGGVIGSLACGLAVQGEAEACLHGMDTRTDPVAQGVANAERQSAQGKHQEALTSVLTAFPDVRTRKAGASPLGDRALRVAARVAVRSSGEIGFASAKDAEWDHRQENLDWALGIFRHIHKGQPSEPVAATDLAEALERFPKEHDEAKRILVGLAQKDVVSSAHGYAALARLRSKSGAGQPSWLRQPLATLEHASLEMDLARCENMTADAGLCGRSRPGS